MKRYNMDELKAHFGDREFTGKDLATHLGLNWQSSGAMIKELKNNGHIYSTPGGWRFRVNPVPAQIATPITAAEPLVMPARMARVGGYYIHESAVLIADVMQDGKVTLFTTILEIDGETKHPRNKKLLFTQQHAPTEYRATIAWLKSMASEPIDTADDTDRETALQLAEEATQKLIAAEKKIADLQAKIDSIKIAMNGALL